MSKETETQRREKVLDRDIVDDYNASGVIEQLKRNNQRQSSHLEEAFEAILQLQSEQIQLRRELKKACQEFSTETMLRQQLLENEQLEKDYATLRESLRTAEFTHIVLPIQTNWQQLRQKTKVLAVQQSIHLPLVLAVLTQDEDDKDDSTVTMRFLKFQQDLIEEFGKRIKLDSKKINFCIYSSKENNGNTFALILRSDSTIDAINVLDGSVAWSFAPFNTSEVLQFDFYSSSSGGGGGTTDLLFTLASNSILTPFNPENGEIKRQYLMYSPQVQKIYPIREHQEIFVADHVTASTYAFYDKLNMSIITPSVQKLDSDQHKIINVLYSTELQLFYVFSAIKQGLSVQLAQDVMNTINVQIYRKSTTDLQRVGMFKIELEDLKNQQDRNTTMAVVGFGPKVEKNNENATFLLTTHNQTRFALYSIPNAQETKAKLFYEAYCGEADTFAFVRYVHPTLHILTSSGQVTNAPNFAESVRQYIEKKTLQPQ